MCVRGVAGWVCVSGLCLEHVEQLEADAHPLLGGDELGPAVGNAPDEVDAVLLDLLIVDRLGHSAFRMGAISIFCRIRAMPPPTLSMQFS